MVTPERSTSFDWEARPSILAQLRAWSAKHPLRPEDGSPPALCDPDEVPIVWVLPPDRQQQPPSFSVRDEATAEELATSDAIVTARKAIMAAQDKVDLVDAQWMLYRAALSLRRRSIRLILDGMIEQRLTASGVRLIARWLLDRAVDGEAVDLAIFLVGAGRDRDVIDDLTTLARHPAFCGLAVWVLDRFGEDTVDLRWARMNRAGCVERKRLLLQIALRLAARPDVRDWIIRHGWDLPNGCAGCVAAACTVAGDLAVALASHDIEDAFLDAACVLVGNLFGSYRGDDLEACPDGVLIVDRLLGHLLDRCRSLEQLHVVHEVMTWLEWPAPRPPSIWQQMLDIGITRHHAAEPESPWPRREALGWTDEVRATLTDDCRRILRRPLWQAMVRDVIACYETATHRELFIAWRVAPDIGVDLWEDAYRCLERDPLDSSLYWWLLTTSDTDRVRRVIALAERILPRTFREMADARLAQERHWRIGTPVASVMKALQFHGMYSERIVALGLRLPGAGPDSGRRQAIAILARHPTETWGEEVVAALRTAVAEERRSEIREGLDELLKRLE